MLEKLDKEKKEKMYIKIKKNLERKKDWHLVKVFKSAMKKKIPKYNCVSSPILYSESIYTNNDCAIRSIRLEHSLENECQNY